MSSNPDHLVNTSPTPRITIALVIIPQKLKNLNSHNFNNYPVLAYIYITQITVTKII